MARCRSALLLLASGGADARVLRALSLKDMDNHKCKVMCQRFGMKALGTQFAEIKNPTECCKKCDEVYKPASLAQVAVEPKAAAQPMASPPKGGADNGSAQPVKR